MASFFQSWTRRAASRGLLAAVAVAACARPDSGVGSAEADANSVLDRFLLGEAAPYTPDTSLTAKLEKLKASQVERRKAAWQVIARTIEPVPIDGGRTLPRFQTWYGKSEVPPLLAHIRAGQTPEDRLARRAPSDAEVDEAFDWIAKRGRSGGAAFDQALAERRANIDDAGAASLGGPDQVLMSPSFVRHLLRDYDAMLRCIGNAPGAQDPPPSSTNASACVGDEFPNDAVVVKASWLPNAFAVPVANTSAEGLTAILGLEEWPQSERLVTPPESAIYTMTIHPGFTSRLVALHIASKELRDWMWTTMFWSDAPSTDFGSDRPTSMIGPWGGYKMCTVVDFDEGDDGANDDAIDPTLAAAFAATRAFGPRSWCSNPNLERGAHGAKTNCIGCHQHAGSGLTTETITEGAQAFPDGSRARLRSNFPADYTFTTTAGGLGDLLQAIAAQP